MNEITHYGMVRRHQFPSSFLIIKFFLIFLVGLSFLGHLVFAACDTRSTINGIPNFGAGRTITSVGNDTNWSDGGTWDRGSVPNASDVVCINTNVIVDNQNAIANTVAIQSGARLSFSRNQNTRLQVDNLLVLQGGTLEIGTTGDPIPASVTAIVEFVDESIDNTFDRTRDPAQFGHGLVALGTVRMHGAQKTYSVRARLENDATQGSRSVTLKNGVPDWKIGDLIAFPDTRYIIPNLRFSNYNPQWEAGTITNITDSNRTLHFDNDPLNFDHRGSYDRSMMPHVANVTRNVVIRSANATQRTHRGITYFSDSADVDVRFSGFENLGRTTWNGEDSYGGGSPGSNQADRHGITLRQTQGPTFIGNAVYNTINEPNYIWGFSLVDVRSGTFRGNTVYNWGGTAIRIMGQSVLNVFEENYLMGVQGPRDVRDKRGRSGNGISGYQRILNNRYINNAAAATMSIGPVEIVAGAGYSFGSETGGEAILEPFLEFSGNEAYGAMATGLVLWNLGSDGGYDSALQARDPMGTIRDFKVYNAYDEAIFAYPIRNIIFDGLFFRGNNGRGRGFSSGDYLVGDCTLIRADIRGAAQGFNPAGGVPSGANFPGVFTIIDSYFETEEDGLSIRIQQTAGTGVQPTDSEFRIIRSRFAAYNNSGNYRPINMRYATNSPAAKGWNIPLIVFVDDFNGQAGEDFQLYYLEQANSGTQVAGGPAPCASAGNCNAWQTTATNSLDGSRGLAVRRNLDFGGGDSIPPAPPRGLRVQ